MRVTGLSGSTYLFNTPSKIVSNAVIASGCKGKHDVASHEKERERREVRERLQRGRGEVGEKAR
jgi:hypothetical protein